MDSIQPLDPQKWLYLAPNVAFCSRNLHSQLWNRSLGPLDALVIVTNPTYPGILIESKPIGLLEMKDDGEYDDKIICVSTNDPRYFHTYDITDIDDHSRSEIAHFFQVYKELEGKKVEILGWKNAKEAKGVIEESIKRYKSTLEKK